MRLQTAEDADRAQLDAFLAGSFRPKKAAFLRNHGDWWHRGPGNRWVLVERGSILGYCAVMPTRVRVAEEVVDAAWWVDLVIDPAHRGRKLQRLFDERVRGRPVTLGFPNAVAARIHRRHGWGVREDLRVRLAPIRPADLPGLSTLPAPARILSGIILRLASAILTPRRKSAAATTLPLDEKVVEDLARLARSTPRSWTTTARNETFLTWRYLEAPQPEQLWVTRSPGAAAVFRTVPTVNGSVIRLLDLVGALGGSELSPLLATAVQQARAVGAVQLTALSSCRGIDRALRAAGLFVRSKGRSCWYAANTGVRVALDRSEHLWTLGDADHDEP